MMTEQTLVYLKYGPWTTAVNYKISDPILGCWNRIYIFQDRQVI